MIGAGLLILATTNTPAVPPRGTLEVMGFVGANYVLGAPLSNALSDQRFGVGGALGIVYRNRYFLYPFVRVGYSFLSKGSARVSAGEPGGPGVISNSLDTFHAAAGVAFQVWRLRFLAGAGAYFFGLRTSFAGVDSSTRDASIGSILGVSTVVYRVDRFHLALTGLAHNAPEAGINYFSFGFSMLGDAISF